MRRFHLLIIALTFCLQALGLSLLSAAGYSLGGRPFSRGLLPGLLWGCVCGIPVAGSSALGLWVSSRPGSRGRKGLLGLAVFGACLLGCMAACRMLRSRQPAPRTQIQEYLGFIHVGDDGYFQRNDERVVFRGVEAIQSGERTFPQHAELARIAGINLAINYSKMPDWWYTCLDNEEISVGQWVGYAGERSDRYISGGGFAFPPSDAFIEERVAEAGAIVAEVSCHENIAFWWIGGEWVNPVHYLPHNAAQIRKCIAAMVEAVRAADPYDRPITCSHHLIEILSGPFFIDYSDLVDFNWFTLCTHMHRGDFEELDPPEKWIPVLALQEKPGVIPAALRLALLLNGGRPFYIPWYTFGPEEPNTPCVPSREATLKEWEAIQAAHVPLMGTTYYEWEGAWHGEGHSHELARERDGFLVLTDNYAGVYEAYRGEPYEGEMKLPLREHMRN